ncbi:MAG: efflux RND transporter periplasmic adaptor subunit [Gemmataceae bacterium]
MKAWIRKLWLIIPTLIVIGLVVYAFMPQPVEADVTRVQRGPLLVTVDEDGRTRIKDRYTVSAPLGGVVQRIDLDPGDAVAAGKTVVARIEPTPPRLLDVRSVAESEARVKSAEAAIERAHAELDRSDEAHELAQQQLARAKMLLPRNISAEEYDIARNKERVALKEKQAAEFALKIAQFELEYARAALLRTKPRSPEDPEARPLDIRSPIDGKVLHVLQRSEKSVDPGAQLIEVGDPRNLEIEVDVLSTDAVKVKPGDRMLLERWGGDKPLEARVRVVEPAGFLKISALGVEEQRVWIIADFVDPFEVRARLGDAYRVEVRIVIWEGKDVLKVPAGAVFRHGEGWAVYRVVNGKVAIQPVDVGHSNGLETEILGGLDVNDEVVVHPSDRIKAGVSIMPRSAEMR